MMSIRIWALLGYGLREAESVHRHAKVALYECILALNMMRIGLLKLYKKEKLSIAAEIFWQRLIILIQ